MVCRSLYLRVDIHMMPITLPLLSARWFALQFTKTAYLVITAERFLSFVKIYFVLFLAFINLCHGIGERVFLEMIIADSAIIFYRRRISHCKKHVEAAKCGGIAIRLLDGSCKRPAVSLREGPRQILFYDWETTAFGNWETKKRVNK